MYRLLEDLVRARFAKPAARAELLADADATLHLLRFQVRLAHDLRLLDTRRYELAARRCAELGAMIGGWRKAGERRRDEAEGRAVPPGLWLGRAARGDPAGGPGKAPSAGRGRSVVRW